MASKKKSLYYIETRVSYKMEYVIEALTPEEAVALIKSGNVEEYEQKFLGEKVVSKSVKKLTAAQLKKFRKTAMNGHVEPSDLVRKEENNNLLSDAIEKDNDLATDGYTSY